MITDFIIVGGGTAGSVVASRLTEIKQFNVLLLEAGPATVPAATKTPAHWKQSHGGPLDWAPRTEPEPHLGQQTYRYPQGKGLGGSMNLFAGIYSRGDRADYDQWREQNNPGWGWSYVEPYFEKPIREGLPISTPSWVHPLTQEFLSHHQPQGAMVWQRIGRQGQNVTSADIYLGRARRENRSNLTILAQCQVVRVLLERDRAVGVEVLREGRYETLRARSEIILAAGALHTPAILLRSGIGPAAHLESIGIPAKHHLPGVGENLQDHPRVGLNFTRPGHAASPTLLDRLRYAVSHTGPFSTSGIEAGAYVFSRPGLVSPDLQLNLQIASSQSQNSPHAFTPHAFTLWASLLRPMSRGYLRLRSADPQDSPALHFHALEEPSDRQTLAQGLEICRTWGAPLGSSLAADNGLPRYGFHWHACGTTRMGEDRMAVVDSNLRVHGIRGLRIIDAGIMPTIPSGNTAFPTLMVAERGADLVRC